jgi:hypothetical protein
MLVLMYVYNRGFQTFIAYTVIKMFHELHVHLRPNKFKFDVT